MSFRKGTPRVHLICNAHLDPVWQWRWQEGCAEALATFRAAHQLLAEHPSFIFNHNESVLYKWVRDYDPALFEEIRRWVREGRWTIAGGWFIQPDVNLPGIESLNRHIAVGRRFFREHFDASPRVAYNFDSFGHSGGLPQLLRQWNYELYIFMRPDATCRDLPDDLFLWRGVDGTEIPACRISIGLYHTERFNIAQRINEGVEKALEQGRDIPVFWGLGDHGGGATREDLKIIDEVIAREERVDIVHSTTERFLEAVRHRFDSLPVVEGDLQRIFTGCYSSLARLKRQERRSLGRLVQAETLCSAASWRHGSPYDFAGFDAAWEKHLFNDFHDILPGTCTAPAEQDALDLYGEVAESARRLRFAAAARMAQAVDATQACPLPLTVLSTHAGLQPVEFECMMDYRPLPEGDWHVRLHRIGGSELPCQEEQPCALLPFNGWRRRIAFMDDLPAVGATHYRVEAVPGKASACATPVEETPPPMRPVPLIIEDDGDSWGSDRWEFRAVAERFTENEQTRRVIESGPIRTIEESVLTAGRSRIVLHTIEYAHWPVVEYRFHIHWNEERRMLKIELLLALADCGLACEVPGGAIARPDDGQEHSQGRWAVVTGLNAAGQPHAVGVANNGQHGLDFANGVLRITALRSAAYCHWKDFALSDSPVRSYMDQGVHEVRLLVTQGSADEVRGRMPGLGDWLDAPPVAFPHLPLGATNSTPPPSRKPLENAPSLLALSPANVRLLACKLARDGNALIVRVHEAAGLASAMTLRLADPCVEIRRELCACEIATFRIERDGTWSETGPAEGL